MGVGMWVGGWVCPWVGGWWGRIDITLVQDAELPPTTLYIHPGNRAGEVQAKFFDQASFIKVCYV